MATLYYGILMAEDNWTPLEIHPIATNPMRCTLLGEWESYPDHESAMRALYQIVTMRSETVHSIHIFAEPLTRENIL